MMERGWKRRLLIKTTTKRDVDVSQCSGENEEKKEDVSIFIIMMKCIM